MKPDENDDLWDLLGKAQQPAASPFFARNVLRAVREQQGSARQGILRWARRFWPAASLATGMAAVVLAVMAFQSPKQDPEILLAHQVSAGPDYQVIAHLDELIDSEHNSAWLDTSAY